jgi:hypothetical protein
LGGAKDAIAKFLAKKEEDDASSNKGGKKRSRATSMPAKVNGLIKIQIKFVNI